MDALPKYQELIDPMLKELSSAARPMTNSEIELSVIKSLGIPNDLVSLIHSGNRTELQYRLAWARTLAKQKGLITNVGRMTWKTIPQK